MDRAAFLNLAGRAGRLLKEFHGNIWCLNPSKWDKPRNEDKVCCEGELLHAIEDSFSKTLEDGGTLIRRALYEEEFIDKNEAELSIAALSKVFSDYIQTGVSLSQSKFSKDENRDDLEETSAECQSVPLDLPGVVITHNPGVHPIRLQRLYEYFRGQTVLDEHVPLMPHESGSYTNMQLIFRITDQYLSNIDNDSYQFHSWLASQWIHDSPLKRIIQERINWLTEHGRPVRVCEVIRKITEALEYDIRYRFVKHTRAYNEVLEFVLREQGRDDLASKIIPLHLFLECGASDSTVLSLLSLGLSRTTALLLKGRISVPDPPTPERCRATLKSQNRSALGLPNICLMEIERIL